MPYGITKKEIELVKKRDINCVYCHKLFNFDHDKNKRKDWDTIEHLNHRPDWDSVGSYHKENKPVLEIIAICCAACNSSRGAKPLSNWFETGYCIHNNINYNTVAQVVKQYVDKFEGEFREK